jgi:hypothetical protein
MDEAQNEFLVGQGDKKIIQWAVSDDKIVQEYDQVPFSLSFFSHFSHSSHFFSQMSPVPLTFLSHFSRSCAAPRGCQLDHVYGRRSAVYDVLGAF